MLFCRVWKLVFFGVTEAVVLRGHYMAKTCDTSKTIVLAGSGRSGTTWMGEILAANPRYRITFEPLNPKHVPESRIVPLLSYVRPDLEKPSWSYFIERSLCGQIDQPWAVKRKVPLWANRNLVKMIRANLMLAWIEGVYKSRIVYMTRHPCAVTLSRLKLKWAPQLELFLSQPALVEDYLLPYQSVIVNANTLLQQHAAMWAIENIVPLQQMKTRKWAFCTYEELYANPIPMATQVLSSLELRTSIFVRRALRRVSRVTRSDSAVMTGRDPLTVWQHDLSKDEIQTILDTVHAFDIDLYDGGPMPTRVGAVQRSV